MRRRRTAHRFKEKRRTADVLTEEKVDFSGLMLSGDVLEGLKSAGFERPSPIQLKAIPLGRCGLDLIAQAKSGTGKTCVFSVIALENINLAVSSVQVLVLAPTREIAVQIKDVMSSIGRHMKGLHTHVFIGGMPLADDKNRLKQCHIAIGTPGRIKHLIESKLLQTTSIRLFILDEADKLLDESFQDQINWIYSTLPSSKQMLALSATYPDHLAQQLRNYMKDPTFVRLNATDPALEGIRHYHCVVPSHCLPHKVFEEKVQSLMQLLSKLSFHQCLIFSNYQIRAKNLSETLAKNGWPSTYISGNQGQSERLSAMAKLKDFKCRILISTDLTSRGIDAERVNLVINMDLPRDSETYLHRVGRAGRFGSYGVTVNFVAEGKEVTSLNEIEANCGVTITPLPDDVSKLLSEEMMQTSPPRSLAKHEVTLLNMREGGGIVSKIDRKTNDCENGERVENENVNVQTTNGNVVKSDRYEMDNTIEQDSLNGEASVEGQLTNNEVEANITVEHNQEECKEGRRNTQQDDMSMENTEEARNTQNENTDTRVRTAKEDVLAETKVQNEEMLEKSTREKRDYHQASIDNTDCTVTDESEKTIFRNYESDSFFGAEQLNSEDCVSDDSESELSSSWETGSSKESSDSPVTSRDSHVPVSCKDFDNVLDAYLKGGSGTNENDSQSENWTSAQSLPSEGAEGANNGKQLGLPVYVNETPSDKYAKKSPLAEDASDGEPNEEQGDAVKKPERHGIYANEPSPKFNTEASTTANSEETMFYGATPDDVTAYMTALPTEWTSTWYRVYERQTNFIKKYTKFCQENF